MDGWSGGGLGVFIALNHHIAVGAGCCRWAHWTVRCATGHCPVRQPRHPTVRVLTVSTVGALTSWCTEQSGAASDRHCSLSGAPSDAALTLHALLTVSADRWSRPLRCSRCSAGTPYSPVNYSGEPFSETRSLAVGGSLVHRTLSGGTPDSPVRQTRGAFGWPLLLC